MKNLRLWYKQPAPSTDEGWEKYSLPIGNGYAGASIFGGADVERAQFTTNEFANVYKKGGVSNFAELFLHFPQGSVENYQRGLRLSDGVAYSKYTLNGNLIEREAFFSYPDRVFVYEISSKDAIDFSAELVIPYLGARTIEEGGRTGEVTVEGDTLVMRGTLPSRELIFEGRLSVKTNGQVCVENGILKIFRATQATVFFVMGTSYKLCEEVFLDGGHKAMGEDPHQRLLADMKNAVSLGSKALYERHREDYSSLISRVEVDLGGVEEDRPTDELLSAYQNGEQSQYLEEVYYAYGRHLLVSSSREGTLPSSLQGVWTVHDKSPWGSGFWHNINIQMNYWPAFSTNLAETFKAYEEYWRAYFRQACRNASEWIQELNPEQYVETEGECGWFLGTGAFCYEIEGRSSSLHSGPGTGGLTSLMFWDYYDYTRDEKVLRETAYPAIHSMSKFLTKTVRDYDGEYLCSLSASPEQILTGDVWIQQHKQQKYHVTVGCAFDQQMVYENAVADLYCSQILGVSDEITRQESAQLNSYSHIQIGYSGQIKEFGEEHFYGEIGQANHRHISQLMSLMPGSAISLSTPAWLDAAKLTLTYRGDESTGWALAHRFCAWARACDGDHAYLLLGNLLKQRTYPNLWDVHPPFQIDGNFGAVAGMTEMLLQSHGGCISIFPALPVSWKKVSFKGLKARGNFTVSASYSDGEISSCVITSNVGGVVRIRVGDAKNVVVTDMVSGKPLSVARDNGIISFDTKCSASYSVSGFAPVEREIVPQDACGKWTENGVELSWTPCAGKYAIYRAVGNDKDYLFIGETENNAFIDGEYNSKNKIRATYKIVAAESHSSVNKGALVPMHPASKLEEERYRYLFHQLNLQS